MWMWPTPAPSALRQPPEGVVSLSCSVARPSSAKRVFSTSTSRCWCSSATQAVVASLSLTVIIGSSAAGQALISPRSSARPRPTATISFSSDAG